MEIRRLGLGDVAADVETVLAAAALFDAPPSREWTEQFLTRDGHHLLMAFVDGHAAGFVSGIEITHPDKGTEMLLYELAVDEAFRRRGVGRALAESLAALARQLGCYDMWVPIEPDNDAAIATYTAAGAEAPEPAAVQQWNF